MSKSVNTFRSKSAHIEIVSPDGTRTPLTALFGAFANRQLTVDTQQPIAASTVVSVEYEDVLFLGDVRRCYATDHGPFQIEIEVKQMINSLTTLMRLRAALLEANAPTSAELSVECVAVRRSV